MEAASNILNMPRWTISYKLPINNVLNPVHDDLIEKTVFPVIIGKQIWILHFLYEKRFLEIIIWNSEILRIPFPHVINEDRIAVISNGDQIYIWAEYVSESYLFTLLKLDTKTMQLEGMLKLRCGNWPASPCIIGDKMYLLDGYFGKHIIVMIDLVKKTLRTIRSNPPYVFNKFLMVHNKRCYILVIYHCGKRVISLIKDDGQLEVLVEDVRHEWARISDFTNGNMFYQAWDDIAPFLRIESFDFSTKKWTRSCIEKPWNYPFVSDIHAVLDIDDCFLVFTQRRNVKYIELHMHVLEKCPKLSHICLLNVAEACIWQHVDINQIRSQLPVELSAKLDNMVAWKRNELVAADNRRLLCEQKAEACAEFRRLAKDGIVEDELVQRFETYTNEHF